MSTSRENAPLVELIAELRWEPAHQTGLPMQVPGLGSTFMIGPGPQASKVDEFFIHFGSEIRKTGHTETERLVPPGLPFLAHQPIFRFRKSRAETLQSLYQLGLGLFSANAVPPYETWKDFRPVVESGVEGMLQARPMEERDKPIVLASLRYIDAFTTKLTEGRDIVRFLQEVMNISISIPVAPSQHLQPGTNAKPVIQLQIPMKEGLVMTFGIGEGMANGEAAILMDTNVASTLPTKPNVVAIMQVFDDAHDAIDNTFSKLIIPIEHLMPRKMKETQ